MGVGKKPVVLFGAACLMWGGLPGGGDSMAAGLTQPAQQFEATAATLIQFDADKAGQTVRLFEVIAIVPPPSWQTSNTPEDDSEIRNSTSGPHRINLSMWPKGQSDGNWKKHYWVLGYDARHDRREQKLSIAALAYPTFSYFQSSCGEDNLSEDMIDQAAYSAMIVLYCQNSAGGEKSMGYGDGVGEILAMRVDRIRDTYVQFTHHWRGRSFDKSKPETWPVEETKVQEMVRRLRAVRLTPAID